MGQLVKRLRCFRSDDTGAVTIDWVAVTAGILLLGIMIVYSVFNVGVSSLINEINDTLVATGADFGPEPVENTGNASDQACIVTARFVVCMGPK